MIPSNWRIYFTEGLPTEWRAVISASGPYMSPYGHPGPVFIQGRDELEFVLIVPTHVDLSDFDEEFRMFKTAFPSALLSCSRVITIPDASDMIALRLAAS